jgi:cyclic pyranopterin phosphate synthase
MSDFTHFDETGASRMVDVGEKASTRRTARASGTVAMRAETLAAIAGGGIAKGNVFEVARLAGIMAAKRTWELIPLCHPLPLDSVQVDFQPQSAERLRIEATVVTTAKTGVEMEALTAVNIAALTVYDMCKAVDRAMTIEQIQLEEKTGGAHGDFKRDSV